jgi:hypothetical protein
MLTLDTIDIGLITACSAPESSIVVCHGFPKEGTDFIKGMFRNWYPVGPALTAAVARYGGCWRLSKPCVHQGPIEAR